MSNHPSSRIPKLIGAFVEAKDVHRRAFAELDSNDIDNSDFSRKEKSLENIEAELLAASPASAAEAIERARFLIAELIEELPVYGIARRFAETVQKDIEKVRETLEAPDRD